MFDELLGFGLMLVLVFLLMFLFACIYGIVWVRTVLGGFSMLFRLIVEVRGRDESDGLFERVIGVLSKEKVYESGYATE